MREFTIKTRGIVMILLIVITTFICGWRADAQIVNIPSEPQINTDSLRRAFADQHYYFGLYKDNYFIFGPPINKTPDKHNTNIKFQISIAQKLTKSTLPWGTYLYLFYTQKVFWNILENSMPMTDLNFNPGIGLTKPLFVKNRFIGKLSLILEHESNGRDGLESRSWNKISFAGSIMVDPHFVVSAKFWIPIVDGENNHDILKYTGIYQVGWQALSTSRKFTMGVTLTRRANGFFNYNTCVEAAWRWSTQSNQYLFLQYYNGYGEGLLAYKQYVSQIRLGIVIKPTLFSEL